MLRPVGARWVAWSPGWAPAFARLAALAALAGCSGEKPKAAPAREVARLSWADAGGAVLAVGARRLEVPAGDLKPGAVPPLDQDEAGTRVSYVAEGDRVRVVYVVGETLHPAPLGTQHASRAPALDQALGGLFAAAAPGAARAGLVKDVRAALGEAGVVKLLVQGAEVDAPEWVTTYAALSPERAAEVRAGLAPRLADPEAAAKAGRASAVLLRETARDAPLRVAQAGCAIAGRLAKEPAGSEGSDVLLESAALVVAANAREACPALASVLASNGCAASVRCRDGAPLDGRTPSRQDEPLCTGAELDAAVKKELARPVAEVGTSGLRVALFAYAALDRWGGDGGAGRLPPAFVTAHARRRYALTQPEKPPCDEVTPGTACHCDEATIRDTACRRAEEGVARVGLCAFRVDDKTKRITEVVGSSPP